uniref:hypothetical protein n=1 Tax=Cellulomonas sp. HZM TaxID=1454010 RepID=UPI0004939A90
ERDASAASTEHDETRARLVAMRAEAVQRLAGLGVAGADVVGMVVGDVVAGADEVLALPVGPADASSSGRVARTTATTTTTTTTLTAIAHHHAREEPDVSGGVWVVTPRS